MIKIEINIETDETDEEYTLWPNGEWTLPKKSEIKINIKKKTEEKNKKEE